MSQPKRALKKKSPFDPARLGASMQPRLHSIPTERRSKKRRAQDLVYDAMEAETSQRRMDLAWQALDLDPEHADALLMVLDATSLAGEERIEALRRIVAVGAKRLGKKAFKEFVPHFWSVLDTRPYMRARLQLAEELREVGRLEEAIVEYEEMIRLNENDNQGVRYYLLPCLFALKYLDEARALLKRYPGDWNVVFAWGRLLERVLSGDKPGAAQALGAARGQNPHMEAYLKRRRKLPKRVPDSYSPGSKDEALYYAKLLVMAWQRHPEAQEWLREQA